MAKTGCFFPPQFVCTEYEYAETPDHTHMCTHSNLCLLTNRSKGSDVYLAAPEIFRSLPPGQSWDWGSDTGGLQFSSVSFSSLFRSSNASLQEEIQHTKKESKITLLLSFTLTMVVTEHAWWDVERSGIAGEWESVSSHDVTKGGNSETEYVSTHFNCFFNILCCSSFSLLPLSTCA